MSGSFDRIDYRLRPSKQTERKLVIETLHRLGKVGYDVSAYRYVGLGSVYFVDFLMFHKYLFIDEMLCIEKADIRWRMELNKPYDFIELVMDRASAVVGTLDGARSHLVWLDYDSRLGGPIIDDVVLYLGSLAPGSVFIITVKVEAPRPSIPFEDSSCRDARLSRELERHRNIYSRYFPRQMELSDIAPESLPTTIAQVLRSLIDREMGRRRRLAFHQLFSVVYSDGTQMLTIGGLIDRPEASTVLSESGIFDSPFANSDRSAPPRDISMPLLTPREKSWLDQNFQRPVAPRTNLGLDANDLENYRSFHRHYPTFLESIL